MSGVMPPNDRRSMESVTPQALADLARSLEDAGPSPHVERALYDEWEALFGASGVRRGALPSRRLAWLWPGLGAAAASVIAVLWLGPSLPDRGASAGPASTGHGTAVPSGPLEPPPGRPPQGGESSAQTTVAELSAPAASSQGSAVRQAPAPSRPSSRPDAAGAVRRGSGRGAVMEPARQTARDEPEPFIWIRGADDIEPGLGVHLVRVQVPRLRWDEGWPSRELVDADVLMGNDGQARAVRVVRTGNQ